LIIWKSGKTSQQFQSPFDLDRGKRVLSLIVILFVSIKVVKYYEKSVKPFK
jgi:hypothetical protein